MKNKYQGKQVEALFTEQLNKRKREELKAAKERRKEDKPINMYELSGGYYRNAGLGGLESAYSDIGKLIRQFRGKN